MNKDNVIASPQNIPTNIVYNEFESFSKIIRDGMLILFLFFGVLGIWATFGKISGAVVVPGTIKIDMERKTVQHLEGGIINDILVREGQFVEAGETLITLKNVLTESSVDMANKNLILSLASRCRYVAEEQSLKKIIWDTQLLKLIEVYGGKEILKNEEKIFTMRQASYHSQLNLYDSQIKQIELQIEGLNEEIIAYNTIIKTLSEEFIAKKSLFDQKYLEKSQILQLEREIASSKGNRGKAKQTIAALLQEKNGILLQKEALFIQIREEAANQISILDSKILQIMEELQPLQDTKKRLNIVAPVGGYIVGLEVHSIGGVITPGQKLMNIVPKGLPLVAEVHIPSDKITDVFLGQEAQIQLTAYDINTTPLIPAKVIHLAADIQEKNSEIGAIPFYLSYIELYLDSIENSNINLAPGMPVTAFITTKKKTILHYIIEPLVKNWDRALRD